MIAARCCCQRGALATRLVFLGTAALLVAVCGCLPRTFVVKDPGPGDRGVRYYRPKPYLMVKPLTADDGTPIDGMVQLNVEWLPDFSEEYSIHVTPGLGINNTEITLDQGWNLTALNVEVDSQFDENLSAIGELVDKAAPLLTSEDGGKLEMAVRATNVPLGLYEAIISCDDRSGKKRLYGFRYVGFLPFEPCPIESGGLECQSCYDTAIYGLVFENGAMVFRPLVELGQHVDTARAPATAVSDLAHEQLWETIRDAVSGVLAESGRNIESIAVRAEGSTVIVTIGAAPSTLAAIDRDALAAQIRQRTGLDRQGAVAIEIELVASE